MSKSKKVVEPINDKINEAAEHIRKGLKQIKESGVAMRGAKAILFMAIAFVIYHFEKASGATTAMLYLYADNGKKSGRADGNVYMRNGRVRGFKVPALVRNAYTSIARTNLASFSSLWNTLTDAQRLSWINAEGVFSSDRFGREVAIKGKALFVMSNTNLSNIGLGPVLSWPDQSAPIGLTSLTGSAAVIAVTNSLVFTPTPLLTGTSILVFATAPKRAGIYRPSQSAYRLIGSFAAPQSSPLDIYTLYNVKFGIPAAGQKLFVRVIVVNNVSGQASAATDINYIVAA